MARDRALPFRRRRGVVTRAGAASAVGLLAALLAAAPGANAESAEPACVVLPWAEEARAGRLEAIPPGSAAELEGVTRIASVELQREQIFDPREKDQDTPLFRLANQLHVLTQEEPIRVQLPIAAGDPYRPLEIIEAERILRRQDWLYDARVVPVRRCGDAVDVLVVTRDVWTILPTGDVDRSGGESSFAIGLEDENLLGRGETLGFVYEDGVDREGFGVFYADPAFLGTPWRLNLSAADNDDGHRYVVNLRRPFVTLDDRFSAGGRLVFDERVQPRFDAGFRSEEFARESVSGQFFLGRSTGRVNGHVRQLSYGLAFFDHTFDVEPGLLTTNDLPPDRRAVYPFVTLDWIEDDFVALPNIGLIQRPQDLRLGRRARFSIGASPDAFGADDGRVVFTTSLSDGARPSEKLLLFGNIGARGVVTTSDGEAENLFVDAGVTLHYLQTPDLRFLASVDGTLARGLTRDVQLQLGGENGLRAYPQRFQQGDRRLRVRLEERWFSRRHPLQLFRYGAAVFVDGGRAWFDGDDASDDEEGWLANVGIGLRLASTRIPTDSVIHLDFAVPLVTGGRDVDDYQISLTVRDQF